MCFKGGTTSAPSARGLGILAFPESPRALGAEARGDSTKNRTPSEIEEVVGLGSVRGIVTVWLLPGAGGESLDRLPTGNGHVLGRERGPRRLTDLQDRPARFIRHTAIVGSVGADSNADGASMAPAAPLGKSRCLVSEGVARSRRTSVDAAIQRA